jgi:nitrate/nitrite-specific signal transduction histidine kinase
MTVLSGIGWGSLRTKIIAWSFVPTAIILAAVAWVTFSAYRQVTEDLVIERDQELTHLSTGEFAARLSEYPGILSEYAGLLADLVRDAYVFGDDPTAPRQALIRAKNRFRVFDGGVVVINNRGRVVAAEPERPGITGQDWLDHSYFRHMLGTPEPVFSDIVADGPGGAEVIVVAVPIRGDQDQFMGVMAGMFRIDTAASSAFYRDIARLNTRESGSTYLVDSNGRVIYHSNPNYIGENFSSHAVVQEVLAGKKGALRTRDVDEQEIVVSFAPVPGTPWGLISEESWETLRKPVQGYQQFLLVLLVLGIVVPTLVVAVGVRQITKPITELIGAAKEVAGGSFGQTIATKTSGEIGELANQFNLMSAQLQESYATLEQRVADRTKELAALNDIAATVSQSLDLDEVLDDALEKTLDAIEVEAGGIHFLNAGAGRLTIATHRGFNPQIVTKIEQVQANEGFPGCVARSGQPLVIKDITADPRLASLATSEEGFRSIVCVPLISKGKILGTLFAMTHKPRAFTEQDVQLLSSIGHQIGVTVENARLFAAEQRRAEQFRVISEMGRHITSILDVDELLEEIVRLLKETFGYYLVTIGLIAGDKLVFRAGAKPPWVNPEFRPPPIEVGGPGITAWVAATGEPLLAPDVREEPRFLFLADTPETRSELAVPLKTKSGVVGVLNVESDQLNAFDESDLAVLQSLAHQAAIAIENARLYEQAQQLAVMQERSRLARELHDAVTQTLFSASLIAEALPNIWESDQAEGRQLLTEMRRLSRGALAEMRTLLLELRPAVLVEARLSDLLIQLVEAITGREDMSIKVTAEECALSPDVHVALYRIAQEALNNIAKHARASQVDVVLRHAGHAEDGGARVELCIRDDGCGFDTTCIPPDRLGLSIMRERAQAIGARLEIESKIDTGTRISVVMEGE